MTTTTTAKSHTRSRLTDEDREKRVQEAHDRIVQGVQAIHTSDDWTAWLRSAAKFHHYSFNNIMLILVQCPDATQVASASKWRELNRWPRRGSKALWIYAPIIVKYTAAEIAINPAREGQTHLVGFRVVPVFDISQTDGQPLPKGSTGRPELLEGEAPHVAPQVAAFLATIGYRIAASTEPSITGALGETDLVAKTITIRPDLSDAQTFKTLIHELAHAVMHDPAVAPQGLTRPTAEVEAESVAFIVCGHFGVTSDAYSFEYVAGWAGQNPDAVVKSGTRVMNTAKKIIAALDTEESGS